MLSVLRRCLIIAPALCVAVVLSRSDATNRLVLTVDAIMRGPGLVGYEPASPRWSGDSQRIYFEWKQATDPVLGAMQTWVVNRDGSGLKKLSDDEARFAPPAFGNESKDHKLIVYARDGDIYIYDRNIDKGRQLTRTGDVESSPHFTRDRKRVWFTRSNNLYAISLDNGFIEELTDIRAAGATPAPGANGGRNGVAQGSPRTATQNDEQQKGTESQEYLKKQDRELLEIIKQRAQRREEDEARKKRENPRKPFTLQARQTISSLALTPDERTVIATVAEPVQRAKNTIVPNFITESGYTEDIPGRAKVGDVTARTRMALIDVASGEVKWVDHGQRAPASPETHTQHVETEADNTQPPKATDAASPSRTQNRDRDVTLSQPVWSEDGAKAVMIARAADNKDRWILALDAATGKTRVIATDHDDAWLDGPGSTTLGWMPGDRDVYFQSERSGYSHLYTVPYEGGNARALTSGNWEVAYAGLSEDKTRFYLTTNEGDPSQVQFYSMPATGGERMKLTSLPGNHRATPSPDNRWLADIYSYTNKPPELYAMANEPRAEEKKLTSSPAAEFWTYPWLDAPLVHFRARDGVELPARLYKPANVKRGGPAVIFVHGAGYLQNVHRWWSYYYREYMFHHMLMERGYIVLDVDYRGSAGYGRNWRTAIYRHMGGKDLEDQVDGARWLIAQHGVDPKRVGIYGGSYGGFITLMAMFTQPDVFAAGAALRPVVDWANYNNGYTSNILNVPQKDADAYRASSPIFFANGLKGALLICHGMVDTNVHFQDTVMLVQKLIELHKENWEVAIYPAEDHGFVQPASWADEYKRILKLFETNLRK
jgi:dipeptidyl aminopeptidase/acylaminoacyl peptidase